MEGANFEDINARRGRVGKEIFGPIFGRAEEVAELASGIGELLLRAQGFSRANCIINSASARVVFRKSFSRCAQNASSVG